MEEPGERSLYRTLISTCQAEKYYEEAFCAVLCFSETFSEQNMTQAESEIIEAYCDLGLTDHAMEKLEFCIAKGKRGSSTYDADFFKEMKVELTSRISKQKMKADCWDCLEKLRFEDHDGSSVVSCTLLLYHFNDHLKTIEMVGKEIELFQFLQQNLLINFRKIRPLVEVFEVQNVLSLTLFQLCLLLQWFRIANTVANNVGAGVLNDEKMLIFIWSFGRSLCRDEIQTYLALHDGKCMILYYVIEEYIRFIWKTYLALANGVQDSPSSNMVQAYQIETCFKNIGFHDPIYCATLLSMCTTDLFGTGYTGNDYLKVDIVDIIQKVRRESWFQSLENLPPEKTDLLLNIFEFILNFQRPHTTFPAFSRLQVCLTFVGGDPLEYRDYRKCCSELPDRDFRLNNRPLVAFFREFVENDRKLLLTWEMRKSVWVILIRNLKNCARVFSYSKRNWSVLYEIFEYLLFIELLITGNVYLSCFTKRNLFLCSCYGSKAFDIGLSTSPGTT